MRRDRTVGWLRRRTAAALFFLVEVFLLEVDEGDCAAAGKVKGPISTHDMATIKEVLIRIEFQR
jgi:hypothetical protein